MKTNVDDIMALLVRQTFLIPPELSYVTPPPTEMRKMTNQSIELKMCGHLITVKSVGPCGN